MANKQKVKSIIRKAIKILRERGWTRYYLAATDEGISISFRSSDASYFCAIGALNRAKMELHGSNGDAREAKIICNNLVPGDFKGNLVGYNDHKAKTKEDIIAIFEKAIEKLDNEKQ